MAAKCQFGVRVSNIFPLTIPLKELGRRLIFYENPDALDPHRRGMLATWLGNAAGPGRRNVRD
jgi:hypothetical protein